MRITITAETTSADGMQLVRNLLARGTVYSRNADGNVGGPGSAVPVAHIAVQLTGGELLTSEAGSAEPVLRSALQEVANRAHHMVPATVNEQAVQDILRACRSAGVSPVT